MTPSRLEVKLQTLSMGMKFLIVGVLAVCMTIPALFVGGLLNDRASRAAAVVREVSNQVGGPQTFLGPTLVIPYTIPVQYPGDTVKYGSYYVFPNEGRAAVKVSTEERRRSLFRVPVFQTDTRFDATFDLRGVPAAPVAGAVLDWALAEIVVGVSDMRGAIADASVTANGTTLTMASMGNAADLNVALGGNADAKLSLIGVSSNELLRNQKQFTVSAKLRFSGARQLAVLAYGKTTHVTVSGDWSSPGFNGSFSPIKRVVSKNGFTAEWSVPFIARGVGAQGPADVLTNLGDTALGVSFVEVADPYQSVSRSLKYILLFIGLVFLSYFVFEVTTGKRVHPAQYILVGAAQLIFYLLLLSVAERVGFGGGFLLAGSATVSLLSLNAKWVFASVREGGRALAIFSSLYTLIYLLLRLEDNALLLGAGASFAAVATAMYLTRQVDWYSSSSMRVTGDSPASEPVRRG